MKAKARDKYNLPIQGFTCIIIDGLKSGEDFLDFDGSELLRTGLFPWLTKQELIICKEIEKLTDRLVLVGGHEDNSVILCFAPEEGKKYADLPPALKDGAGEPDIPQTLKDKHFTVRRGEFPMYPPEKRYEQEDALWKYEEEKRLGTRKELKEAQKREVRKVRKEYDKRKKRTAKK